MKRKQLIWIVLFVFFIGGFWLSQNRWLLYREVSIESYSDNIIGVWQNVDANDYTWQNVTEFYSDGRYEIRNEQQGIRVLVTGKYQINENILTIVYDKPYQLNIPTIKLDSILNVQKEIIDVQKDKVLFFKTKYIKLKTIESKHPGPWGDGEIYKKLN